MQFEHIIADPGWPYNNRLTGKGRTKFGGGAPAKYTTESIEDMAKFAVEDVAADDALLHIWATGPHIPSALCLIDAWGFSFVTIEFVWIKTLKPKRLDIQAQLLAELGAVGFMQSQTRRMPGHYTASNTELVLLGRRGKALIPTDKMLPQVIYAPPSRVHSRKPSDVHEYIERCYAGQRWLELFARRERPGWTCLGNEIDGRDLRESLPALCQNTRGGM